MSVIAVQGTFKKDRIILNEIPKGLEEGGEVIVVFKRTNSRRKTEKDKILEGIKESMKEVKLMQEGKLSKLKWWDIRDGL